MCPVNVIVFIVIAMYNVPEASTLVNAPKIIARDGNLIFESGLDRNISFRLMGKSRLNINDEYDLLDLLMQTKKGRTSVTTADGDHEEWSEEEEATLKQLATEIDSIRQHVFGSSGLKQRFGLLLNNTRITQQLLRRYAVRMQRVETRVKNLYDRLEKDNCRSNPCENGGTCFSAFGGFICKCSKYFEGRTCNVDVNECALYAGTDLGCQNDAQCVNQFGTFSCMCQPGWFGIHCSQRKGDCMQSSSWELCGHGICVSSNDTFGYKCLCDQGWKTNGLTPACTVDVDECTESHTTCTTKCINLPGSFTCAPCATGLTGNGINCVDVDECAVYNGGCSKNPKVHCINTYGSYYCGECPLGWVGDGHTCVQSTSTNAMDTTGGDGAGAGARSNSVASCSNNNICHPLATCNEISNTVVCSCPDGMIGSGVGPNGCVRGTNKNCINQPCQNGGTCFDNGDNYKCLCPSGYVPPNCTPEQDPCNPNPCLNNGRCVSQPGQQWCQCLPGFGGRRCERRFNRCGGVLASDKGRLTYPLGSLYENNAQCAWVIRTNESSVLNVTFNKFELEDGTECRFDWLQMNDGRTAADQLIGRFCGSRKPLGGNIISSTHNLYLWFKSDNSTSKEGFDLEWNSIPPQCGGLVQVQSHGTIATPGAPGNYPKNRDCRWQLKAANDKRLKLTFFRLNIEQHNDCNYDFVKITDAISGNILEKYCNTTHPQPLLLPTNEADIYFHSDNFGTDSGFQIYYSTEERIPGCGGTYTARKGQIQSPTFIENTLSCEYEIVMPSVESLTLEFKKFHLSNADDCVMIYGIRGEEKLLKAKYCGDYNIIPPIIRLAFNRVLLKFYGKTGSDFRVVYQADCSKTYEAPSGTVLSPNYPNLLQQDLYCTYRIITEPSTIISLDISDFDLFQAVSSSQDEDDCSNTYLKVFDNMDIWNTTGLYCNRNPPAQHLVSKTNMLSFIFKRTFAASGRGFKMEYKSLPMGATDCGGVYTKPGYEIRLPTDEEGFYMHNMECYWIILAPPQKIIFLNWLSFRLEDSADCSYDYVDIYDDLGKNTPLERYCNAHKPQPTLYFSSAITVKFVSDAFDTMEGFQLTYDFIDASDQCGGNIHATTGRINSPNWPLNYTSNMDCTWIINTAVGTQMELKIEIFDLEFSKNCANDWLEIRNGGSNHSTLMGRFCGNYSTIPDVIPSFTNQIWLNFHTNAFLNQRGFQIHWVILSKDCGGNLNANAGIITSPLYPKPYPNNAVCEWNIRVPSGSLIHFSVDDFALESSSNCQYDVLELIEDPKIMHNLIGLICSSDDRNETRQFISKYSEVLVRFVSDVSNRYRGFLLSFYYNCTATLNQAFGVIESPNFGGDMNHDEQDINCTWTIKAPKGNQVHLQFSHFFALDDHHFVSVEDGNKTFKIAENHYELNSTGNTLLLRQTNKFVSFRLEYKVLGCVQNLFAPSGNISTPNYPRNYANNIECSWDIITIPGQVIRLHIFKMHMQDSINCTKDALIVTSHPQTPHVKERHCGVSNGTIITSAGHHLYLRFYSDATITGQGFLAGYTTIPSVCGGVYKNKHGVITSPNYPNEYPIESDCEWTIKVSPYHSIILVMEELDLEEYHSCTTDYVEAEDSNNVQLFKVCGTLEWKNNTTWRSTSNIVTVRFYTDTSVGGKGFKLSYYEDCGSHILLEKEFFAFMGLEQAFEDRNQTCQWQFEAKDAVERVLLTIDHVHLNKIWSERFATQDDCLDHGGVIYEGLEISGPVREKFCKHNPPAVISNGHALTLTVPMGIISRFSVSATLMTRTCGLNTVYSGSISGKFTSPYYPASYTHDMDCEWTLTATLGNSMIMTIEFLDLEDSMDCNNDFLEIREHRETGALLGVLCGNQLPEPFGPKPEIWLKFRSDGNGIVGGGFVASYNYAMHNELNSTEGTIQSPTFPGDFYSTEKYSWRITVDKDYVVLLYIKLIRDNDIPFIQFYDGYTDIGAPIEYENTRVLQSSTNILYFTANRGPFHFEWRQLSKDIVRANRTAQRIAQLCGSNLIRVDSQIQFQSPGYPLGYESNLNCSWVLLAANDLLHVELLFKVIDLENDDECADYVSISSSSDLQNWKHIENTCKKATNNIVTYKGEPYLKVDFVTDSYVNNTGFSSVITTECGSPLNRRRGFVNITEISHNHFKVNCVWTIRVRHGRRIRIKILDSFLHESEENVGECNTYFLIRNGIAEDSPFLNKGKYCNNNINDILETSSNHAYVKFSMSNFRKFRASFHYEEIIQGCSKDKDLSDNYQGDSTETITSPNYPNLPNPHSECIWTITAPFHKTISVHFWDSYDLAQSFEGNTVVCDREYVQINDGSTNAAPLLGRFCGTKKPNTLQSTSNILRLLYFTDLSEPHLGFKANVTITRCGGSYYEKDGVIKSPQNIKFRSDETEVECIYNVEVPLGSTITIEVKNLHLPFDYNCTKVTHVELQEIVSFNAVEENVTDTLILCGMQFPSRFIVEANKLKIKFRIKNQLLDSDEFEISYSAVGTRCGQTIRGYHGILQTPDYPRGTRMPTMCSWRIQAPKGKRIKLEILDFDTGTWSPHMHLSPPGFRGRLVVANDFAMTSIIARISSNPPAVLYSTDNTMGIDAFLLSFSQNRGFKLRYTAMENSIQCDFPLQLSHSDPQTFNFTRSDETAIYCKFDINVDANHTLVLKVLQKKQYDPAFMIVYTCVAWSPLKIMMGDEKLLPNILCQNVSQPVVRLPYSDPIQLILSGNNRNRLHFLELQYQMYKCGGTWSLVGDGLNISEPHSFNQNSRVECAWLVLPHAQLASSSLSSIYNSVKNKDIQINIKLRTDFKGKCDDEYIVVYNGPNQNWPHLGRFCQQSSITSVTINGGLFFEFVTNSYSNQSKFNMSLWESDECGGKLTYPFKKITYPSYENNIECIWEVISEAGFHFGIRFLHRFFIESSTNCSKDYLKFQQRSPGEAEWQDFYILCGRTPPPIINSSRSEMRIIFRSDNDTTGDGFTIQIERNCGGEFYTTNEMQQIQSPGYPFAYPSNITCNYTILPSPELTHLQGGNNLLVRFLSFEVEAAMVMSCIFDNVTIYTTDYFDRTTESVLCGKKLNYEVRGNKSISIVLRTDESYSSQGFLFEYGPNKCGATITNSTIIQSPKDYENNHYPHSTKCIWYLQAQEHYKILLKFQQFDFESQHSCSYDGLEIYKGLQMNPDDRLVKLCGNLTKHFNFMHIPQNTAVLVSYSDSQDSSRGFRALVSFIKNCDRSIFLNPPHNATYNFNDYSQQYDNNLDCSWLFTSAPGYQLLIEFESFHIEDSKDCMDDFIEIHDGKGIYADSIGKFCGHNIPLDVTSSGNAVMLRFVSDAKGINRGFSANIKAIPTLCGAHSLYLDNNQVITIQSPEETTGKYLTNINCIWKIESKTFIHFHFDKLDLEGPDNDGFCSRDYLKFVNSEDIGMVEKGFGSQLIFNGGKPLVHLDEFLVGYEYSAEYIYCGNQKPSDYYSGSKTVFIKFHSNENVTNTGFNLKISQSGVCYQNFTGIQGRILFRNFINDCVIFITSPKNTTLSLYYQEVIFNEIDCRKEYIEVFDVHTNASLQKICHFTELGKALFSQTNELRLHLQLNGTYSEMSLSYVASTQGPGCGGDLYNIAGLLTNPYYPQHIRNNSICDWNIRVPHNLKVLIKFRVFDMGASSTCHTDYLQIIEQQNDGSEKVMRQFCGGDDPDDYQSTKSFLSIRFHKTVNYDGTGWVLTFDGVYGSD